ncbi:MAG: hypothetical protein AABX05_03575, partial [Nanoarchaeota archaeon]
MAGSIIVGNLEWDSEAVRRQDGDYLLLSQINFERYLAGSGQRLPTVEEIISGLKSDSISGGLLRIGLLQDLRESALCAGRIDYRTSNLPEGSGYLKDLLLQDSAWKKALEDELFHYDAEKTVSLLKQASGKEPYIRTPDEEGRRETPERTVWLAIYAVRFGLDCYGIPFLSLGRARGVRDLNISRADIETITKALPIESYEPSLEH